MSINPVAVEKLAFSEESRILGDRKCLGDWKKSFVVKRPIPTVDTERE
jgi:hypothetical protein